MKVITCMLRLKIRTLNCQLDPVEQTHTKSVPFSSPGPTNASSRVMSGRAFAEELRLLVSRLPGLGHTLNLASECRRISGCCRMPCSQVICLQGQNSIFFFKKSAMFFIMLRNERAPLDTHRTCSDCASNAFFTKPKFQPPSSASRADGYNLRLLFADLFVFKKVATAS